jgi:hypothetical protein
MEFIFRILEYIQFHKAPTKLEGIFAEIISAFSDGCDHCFKEFRNTLIEHSSKLKLHLDLDQLVADFYTSATQKTAPTTQNEVVKVQQEKYLRNPFQFLEIDTSATKGQILAGVLAQIKRDPQKMAATRQAQGALFDPFSGPVFRFMYQLYSKLHLEHAPEKGSTTLN